MQERQRPCVQLFPRKSCCWPQTHREPNNWLRWKESWGGKGKEEDRGLRPMNYNVWPRLSNPLHISYVCPPRRHYYHHCHWISFPYALHYCSTLMLTLAPGLFLALVHRRILRITMFGTPRTSLQTSCVALFIIPHCLLPFMISSLQYIYIYSRIIFFMKKIPLRHTYMFSCDSRMHHVYVCVSMHEGVHTWITDAHITIHKL